MNLLFRLFIFLGSIVVIALFAALIAPYFIDWDEFTSEFEAQASRVIGQEVKVGGKTNLRLLPLPYLSFEDLQVGKNLDGSPMMTVDQFSFNAELLPFLSGEVRILEMSMQSPKVNLRVAENGTIPWTSPKELLVNPEQVNIEKLNIENGSIVVTGLLDERSLQLEKIYGDLNAKSILGPWRINAEAEIDGIASQMKISTGTFQGDGSMRLKMDLNRKDKPYNLLLDGPVKLQNDALSWNGEFRVSQFGKSQIEEMDIKTEPLPVFSSGSFQASPRQVDINEYSLEVGAREDPYIITGQGVISIQDEIYFKMQADGRQIDVDQLKSIEEQPGKVSLEDRLAALHDVLKRVPVPSAKGEIDVILPAIVAGDTFIRDVKALISPTGSGWAIRTIQATLPGNTAFEAKGRLGLQNGFGFSGKILIASRQPSGFASWISGNVDETFRRLDSAGLSGDLTITKRQATLENVEMRLDDALLRGKLQRLASENGRPAILAELRGNRINLDDLSAVYSLTKNPDEADAVHDLNIKVQADVFEAMIAGKPFVARGLDAHAQVRDGTVSIEHLNASDLLGAKIATTGRIENILSKPNGNMKLTLDANNAIELLEFSKQFLGENTFINTLKSRAQFTENTKLKIEIDTTGNASGAKGVMLVNGIMGGSVLSIQAGFDGALDDLTTIPISVDVTLSNPKPSSLMQQFGIKTLPTDIYGEIPGDLKFNFAFIGVAKDGMDTRVSLLGNDASFAASGKISTNNWNDYDAQLYVTLGAENASTYLLLSDVALPGLSSQKALPLSASFMLTKTKSDFVIEELKGQMAGNMFAGNLMLQQEQVSRPRVTGKLDLGLIDIPLLAETVFGRTTALGSSLGIDEGISFDESSAFGEALLLGYDANVLVTSNRLNLSDELAGKKASFQLGMLDGALDLNALSFEMMGGQVDGGLNLKNTAGNVLANINYSVRNMDAKQFINSIDMPEFISGSMFVDGSMETSGQSFAALISNLSGNGFVALKDGEVKGLNPKALDPILIATSVDKYEINSEKIQKLFAETALTSGFSVASVDTPFSINRGNLRVRNVRVSSANTDFVSDMEFNLQAQELDARTVVEFEPKRRDQISGADPQAVLSWSGTLAALEREIDVDRLEGYLSLRAFETSQRRLETIEAQVIEKQRLRNEITYAFVREQYQERKLQEALRLEEERKLREVEEARRLEEEDKKRAAEAAEKERLRKIAETQKREEDARLARLKAEAEKTEALNKLQSQTVPPSDNSIINQIENFLNTN